MKRGSVEIIRVICTTLTTRGSGAAGDGFRTVTQYWSLLAGELLFEDDPQVTGRGEVVYLERAPALACEGSSEKDEFCELGYGD